MSNFRGRLLDFFASPNSDSEDDCVHDTVQPPVQQTRDVRPLSNLDSDDESSYMDDVMYNLSLLSADAETERRCTDAIQEPSIMTISQPQQAQPQQEQLHPFKFMPFRPKRSKILQDTLRRFPDCGFLHYENRQDFYNSPSTTAAAKMPTSASTSRNSKVHDQEILKKELEINESESEIVFKAIEAGFSNDKIKLVQSKRLQQNGTPFKNASELIIALLEEPSEAPRDFVEASSTAACSLGSLSWLPEPNYEETAVQQLLMPAASSMSSMAIGGLMLPDIDYEETEVQQTLSSAEVGNLEDEDLILNQQREIANLAVEAGFSYDKIKLLVSKRIQEGGEPFNDTYEMIQALLELDETGEQVAATSKPMQTDKFFTSTQTLTAQAGNVENEDLLLNSEIANLAVEAGFSYDKIKLLLSKRIQEGGEPFNDTYEMIQALLELDETGEQVATSKPVVTDTTQTSTKSLGARASETSNNLSSAEAELLINALLEASEKEGITKEQGAAKTAAAEERDPEEYVSKLCKICLADEVRVVFLPCGHLVCCVSCAKSFERKTCPLCRQNVTSTVTAYLA